MNDKDLGHAYELLDRLTAYQKPAIIMAAHRLAVFEALARGAAGPEELASELNVPQRSLGVLLRACVALGLLERKNGVYKNSELAAVTLVPKSPGYIGRLVDKEYVFYQAWADLAGCVALDEPALAPIKERARRDPETTRNFLEALDDIAALYGGAFSGMLDLQGNERVLDIGGGVGSYAVALTRDYPELEVTVLDLPVVAPWARNFVENAGLSNRVDVQSGDFMTDGFPSGYDIVLFSNIFHDQPPTINRGLLANAYAALSEGGSVVVHDFLLDDDRVSPVGSAVFAVMMLVENAGGNVYTGGDIESWLATAGFREVTSLRFPEPSPMGLVQGRKLT